MKSKGTYLLGLSLVVGTLIFSLWSLQGLKAQGDPNQPQVEAVDPEVQAILEQEAELIRQMNEAQGMNNSDQSQQGPSGATNPSADPFSNIDQSSNPQSEALKEVLDEGIGNLPNTDEFRLEYDLGYSPEELRDPFALPSSLLGGDTNPPPSPESEAQSPTSGNESESVVTSANPYLSYFLGDYKIVGILWGVAKPKAMITAPSGKMLTVTPGNRLGREGAVVWKIREKEIVFLMPDRSGDFTNGSPFVLKMRN